MEKKVIGIIPARYKSSRFPGKPLVKLLNKPMIIWVAELSAKALGKENVYVATDDERIAETVKAYDFNVIMTSELHLTGTDRLVEVANVIEADIYINIQGDEPTLNHSEITKIVNEKIKFPNHVINAVTEITEVEDPKSINIPKVVFNEKFDLIYMSRLDVPGYKDPAKKPEKYFKQVCIYAFNKKELNAYGEFGRKSTLEKSEDIEILRFLDLNIPVRMVMVERGSYAVDTYTDVELVENKLKEFSIQEKIPNY